MPTESTPQRLTFDFLRQRLTSQEEFSKGEMQTASGFTETSFNTYWSKQFKPFLVDTGHRTFRVSEAFRPYSSWGAFREHVSQVRLVSADYKSFYHDHVLIFEFFMPLTNENQLRMALDALFYRDTILARLKTLDPDRLSRKFSRREGETQSDYDDRFCTWVQERFGGYSISHVSGRFRAADLMTIRDAAALQDGGERYLVDETTAVVRFIFPCGARTDGPPFTSQYFEDLEVLQPDQASVDEANQIRWFFGMLFVQSIVQVVNGEDEIMMVESGMRNRLHIWKMTD